MGDDATLLTTANIDNWDGTDVAKQRLPNYPLGDYITNGNMDFCGDKRVPNRVGSVYTGGAWVGDDPLPMFETFYFACNNGNGFHLNNRIQNTINKDASWQCDWGYDKITGYDISVWIGFDAQLTEYCQFNGGSYELMTGAPTMSPTRIPTQSPTTLEPTVSPSMNPTVNPSSHPSTEPSVAPSENPTQSPSNHPSIDPTVIPSELPTTNPNIPLIDTSSPTIQIVQSTAATTDAVVTELKTENQDPKVIGMNIMTEELFIVGAIGIGAFVLACCACIGICIYCFMQRKKYKSSTAYVEEVSNEDAGWWANDEL